MQTILTISWVAAVVGVLLMIHGVASWDNKRSERLFTTGVAMSCSGIAAFWICAVVYIVETFE